MSTAISSLFNCHLTFYVGNLGLNYINVIGFCLFSVFILQVISGLLLSIYYTPVNILAFDSILYIYYDVNYGFIISWFHVIGSSVYMLLLLMHTARAIWYNLQLW